MKTNVSLVIAVALALATSKIYAQGAMVNQNYEESYSQNFIEPWPRNDFFKHPSPCRQGGNCFLIDQYAFEVQLRPYGKVKGWLRARDGAALASRCQTLQATVPTTKGSRSVDLRWDPSKQLYVGYVPESVHPRAGRTQLSAAIAGRKVQASGLAALTPSPSFGGQVIAAGPYSFEILPFADGRVEVRLPESTLPARVAPLRLQLAMVSSQMRPVVVPLKFSKKHGMFLGHAADGKTFGTGPVELEVRDAAKRYVGMLDIMKPIARESFSRWTLIVGPYSVEMNIKRNILSASVHDEHNQLVSSKNGSMQVNLNKNTYVENSETILTFDMRWNPNTLRFEANIPSNFSDPHRMHVRVARPGFDKSGEAYLWRGAILWDQE